MTHSRFLISTVSIVAFFCSSRASPPIAGPLLPRPTSLAQSSYLSTVTSNLTALFDKAIKSPAFAGWPTNNSSFSIALTSFSQPLSDPVIWDYHYLAPERGPGGTTKSNGDSQYMIASISKVFTDLVLLKSNISLEDPITKYLPELQTRETDPPTAYEEITVGMLCDHLSGMVQNCMLTLS